MQKLIAPKQQATTATRVSALRPVPISEISLPSSPPEAPGCAGKGEDADLKPLVHAFRRFLTRAAGRRLLGGTIWQSATAAGWAHAVGQAGSWRRSVPAIGKLDEWNTWNAAGG